MKFKNIFLGTLALSSIFGLTSCDLLDKKPVEQAPPQTENNSANEEKHIVIGPMALTYTTDETITEESVLKNYSLMDAKNNVVEIGKSEVVGFNNIKQGMDGVYNITVNLYSKENKLYSFNVIINIIKKQSEIVPNVSYCKIIGPMSLKYYTTDIILVDDILKQYQLVDSNGNIVEAIRKEVIGFNDIKQDTAGIYMIGINFTTKDNKLYNYNVMIQIIQKEVVQNTCIIPVSETIVDLDTNKKEYKEVNKELVKTDTIEKYLRNLFLESQNKEESLDYTIVLKNGSIIDVNAMRTQKDETLLVKTTLEEVENIYLHRILPSVNNAHQVSISVNNADGTISCFNEITRKNTRIRDFYVELIVKCAASNTNLKSFEITFNNGYSVTSEDWLFKNPNETMMNVKQITLNFGYDNWSDGQSGGIGQNVGQSGGSNISQGSGQGSGSGWSDGQSTTAPNLH